jgi:hypothetical protein
MKRLGVFALLMLAAGAAAAAAAESHVAAPSAARCGGQTWRLKTFSDLQRTRVDVKPQSTTLGAIRERRGPGRAPTRRMTQYQLHTWEVPAQVTAFRLDATGSVRLVSVRRQRVHQRRHPVSRVPVAAHAQRASILAAWHLFVDKCGHASSDWQPLGAIFFVRGLGFWGGKTPQRGGAPNGAELHPVTGLRVVAGC